MILMIKPHLYQFVLVDTLLTHESTLFCENEGGDLYCFVFEFGDQQNGT